MENGVEVEATVVGYDYHSASHGVDGDPTDTSSGWYYIWECRYADRKYSGTSGGNYFGTEQQVLQYMGETFTVTVDPNSNWAVDKPLSEIHADGFHYKEYFICAIIFTCLSPFTLLFFAGFVIYPMVLDGKIDKCGKLPVQGEVIKVSGFLAKYIKVRYEDKDKIKEKWSYGWFTRKEAKFLRQKKIITIVPYKNTYGVVEETSR